MELCTDDVDYMVDSVESLSLRSTTLGRMDDGFCFWQASYPCYVDRISFNGPLSGSTVSFGSLGAPFTFRSAIGTGAWTLAEQLKELTVRS